jgi:uncharacterized coiled-coil protein SlyX
LEETRKAMGKEVDNHNIENQKVREEFEGMLRSFDKLIEENRKKKQRIEELLVNKALLEKNIVDLEKEVAEDKEEMTKQQGKIDNLSEEKRKLEMLTGVIPELKEQIQIVSAFEEVTKSIKKTSRISRIKTEFWMPTTKGRRETKEANWGRSC